MTSSRQVEKSLRAFAVFEDKEWMRRPSIGLLDAPRRDRLLAEVNELLFLWAVVLEEDRSGTPAVTSQALRICAAALNFASPSGPWRAMQARCQARLAGEAFLFAGRFLLVFPNRKPRPAAASSGLCCTAWMAVSRKPSHGKSVRSGSIPATSGLSSTWASITRGPVTFKRRWNMIKRPWRFGPTRRGPGTISRSCTVLAAIWIRRWTT